MIRTTSDFKSDANLYGLTLFSRSSSNEETLRRVFLGCSESWSSSRVKKCIVEFPDISHLFEIAFEL